MFKDKKHLIYSLFVINSFICMVLVGIAIYSRNLNLNFTSSPTLVSLSTTESLPTKVSALVSNQPSTTSVSLESVESGAKPDPELPTLALPSAATLKPQATLSVSPNTLQHFNDSTNQEEMLRNPIILVIGLIFIYRLARLLFYRTQRRRISSFTFQKITINQLVQIMVKMKESINGQNNKGKGQPGFGLKIILSFKALLNYIATPVKKNTFAVAALIVKRVFINSKSTNNNEFSNGVTLLNDNIVKASQTSNGKTLFKEKLPSMGKKEVNSKITHVYLGSGFLWTKSETKALYDIIEQKPNSVYLIKNPEQKGNSVMQHLKKGSDVYIPLKFLDGHTLITGTTGSGKTRLFDILISQALLRNETVIVIDPKGDRDLYQHIKEICTKQDKDKFLFLHPGFIEESINLNPLYNFTRSTELASRIASLIPTMKGGNNDPFKSFSFMLVDVIVGALSIIGKRPTLKIIKYYADGRVPELALLTIAHYNQLNTPKGKLKDWEKLKENSRGVMGRVLVKYYEFYVKYVKPKKSSSIIEGLYSKARHDATHTSKMVGSLISALETLCTGGLGNRLSPDDEKFSIWEELWDFQKIIDQHKVLYIGLDSLTDSMVCSALGSLLLSDLAAVAGNRYNYQQNLNTVNIFVDETAEVLNEQLIQLLNKGRGAKFRITIATQTVSDIASRLGSKDKAYQVLGNLNNLISLRVIDEDTRKYVASALGTVRVDYSGYSLGDNRDADEFDTLSLNYTESKMEQETEIFPSHMLSELPDLEYVARVGGATIYKGKIPLLV